ncbi:N-acetylmuramoyl-L-alanine amidase [Peterkaempfera bronchialis]|uniref:Peptidoglycan-binding domain-containing protein n=1 Tax=Peterkaempfera bronchialis TaxID=2126346 RepID=A0A345SU39_9ACTN|nr:N-acetylmuramoyl-L-alanine amidase [Peterkaempfera bronchialis]AXI77244.1 peptidoglycan-binding domain-containing protein [Peterkaempfera bronchialis]
MARMPGADYRPVVNVHKNGVLEHRGLVLHVQDGTGSPYGWFNQTSSQASSDFWVGTGGTIEQYCDTGVDYAFAQAAGNPYYASVETEGRPDTALTAEQLEGVAHIYAWGHSAFGWPLAVVDSTTEHGFTYHGVGGEAWGNHPDCPGDLRKAQRPAVIARAKEIVGTTSGGGSVSLAHVVAAARKDPGAAQGHTTHRSEVLVVERALQAEGLLAAQWVDGSFGTKTVTAYAALQRRYGFSGADADGIPGRTSLTRLGAAHGFTVTA